MLKMGFSAKWVGLAMQGMSSLSYSVLINGEPCGFIFPSRGIKQGDPLSPYLFLFCVEGLSALLWKAIKAKQVQGINSCCNGVNISHILFTDDNFLFCPAISLECTSLLNIMSTYEYATGQAINQQKKTLFFSPNTAPTVREEIRRMFDAQVVTEVEKYLGLVGGMNNVSTFKDLWERIAKRVMGWKEKFNSKAREEVLIKTIAQVIPIYSMSLFQLLKMLCNDINSIMEKYQWGQTSNENKIHWINQKWLCNSKKSGGMGFRDIHTFNLAMLAKQA